MRSIALWLCVFIMCLGAHPSVASYLDGPFFSFGVGLGGGDALESEYTASNNAAQVQAYRTEIQAYNEAIARLKSNQAQTTAALKNLIQQLQDLNPSSSALNALIAQIQSQIDTPGANLESVISSVNAYQDYLNKTFNQYQEANQQLLNQAQNALNNYKKELGNATDQNQAILKNAIKTFDDYNEQVAKVAKELGTTYTPLALPPILQGDVSKLTPSQVSQALSTLSNDINHIISVVSQDINKLDEANQKIAVENAQNLSNLTNNKNNAITNALNQIASITQIVGRAFRTQWIDYAQGHTFFLKNAANEQYINAGDTCVFQIIINNNTDNVHDCGYQGGTAQALSQFQQQAAKYHLTPQDIWDTLFNIGDLKKNVYIGPSNCSNGGCVGAGVSESMAQEGMRNFFKFMNDYVGAANFEGNFANSTLYTILSQALNKGDFTEATGLVDAYVNEFVPDMLQTFVLNPVWFMSVIPGSDVPPAIPPSTEQERNEVVKQVNSASLRYCYASPSVGLEFSQGYGVCQYNWWAHGIFLGYFGYLSNQTSTLTNQLQAQLGTIQTGITSAQSATNAYNNFKPNKLYPIPDIPPYSTTPTPMPIPPVISGSANSLPQLIKPKAPVITFSSRNLNMHSLQFGLQTQGGYQKYFNPFFGMSAYGYMGYRYLYIGKLNTNSNLNAINHYTFGFGTNLLFNFYSKIQKPEFGPPKIRTYGFFAGLLGVLNLWNSAFLDTSAQHWRKNVNIDGVFGFSMRFDRFQWMLGVHVPLVDASQHINISTAQGTETITLVDSYKSASLFLNCVTFF
ncbi:outer membrane beta-barrel protein [Helicobacter baculiformis]|uniref:Outer membrane beta-barrel protein n=1 Tax=Helicobacter baculiformis TaxID=427351 RepID=A0ABV7ZHF1_9HELI|nr:outer membrane beta-barrel protein [Helicobacter baculiformis]